MRQTLSIIELKAGMVLAATVKTQHGQLIAKAGTVLNRSLITRMSFYNIKSAEVETDMEPALPSQSGADALLSSIEVVPAETAAADSAVHTTKNSTEQPVAPAKKSMPKQHSTVDDIVSYQNKLMQTDSYHQFQLDYTRIIAKLKRVFRDIQFGKVTFSYDDALADCRRLFQSKTSLELLSMVHTMRALDDSIYAHCLNVALISRTIGKWLRMSKDELDTVTLAGLFHDIGKITIPTAILNKTDSLTDAEFRLIQQHPLEGNKMLRRVGMDVHICNAALQHHERFDGSGYPRNLSADEIDDFAAIVAIADVYDAMTATRTYRSAKCAFQVIQQFEQDGLQKYKTKYILTFLERIANLHQNSQVLLNDGRNAKVVFINKGALSRPVVELMDREMLDLSRNRDINITSIV